MATYELAKTIEARKLNPRSKLPLPEPAVTIPFGAVLTDLEWLTDLARFHYLGELYQCEVEVLRDALGKELSAKPSPGAAAQTAAAEPEAPPPAEEPETPEEPSAARAVTIEWEDLPSPRFRLSRTKVPGGWLVAAESRSGLGLAFYPDPDHRWEP